MRLSILNAATTEQMGHIASSGFRLFVNELNCYLYEIKYREFSEMELYYFLYGIDSKVNARKRGFCVCIMQD